MVPGGGDTRRDNGRQKHARRAPDRGKDFFAGIMSTALAEDELLVEARPLLAADAKFGFNEFNRRAGDFAMSAALVAYRLHKTARSRKRA